MQHYWRGKQIWKWEAASLEAPLLHVSVDPHEDSFDGKKQEEIVKRQNQKLRVKMEYIFP